MSPHLAALFLVLVPAGATFALCIYYAVAGPLQLGRPLPPRRDGSRATPEEDAVEREDLRATLQGGARRTLVVLPVFIAGVVLIILGQELPNATLSAVGPWVLGVGLVLGTLAYLSNRSVSLPEDWDDAVIKLLPTQHAEIALGILCAQHSHVGISEETWLKVIKEIGVGLSSTDNTISFRVRTSVTMRFST